MDDYEMKEEEMLLFLLIIGKIQVELRNGQVCVVVGDETYKGSSWKNVLRGGL